MLQLLYQTMAQERLGRSERHRKRRNKLKGKKKKKNQEAFGTKPDRDVETGITYELK